MGNNAPFDLFIPFQIVKELELTQSEIHISPDILPKQYIDGNIRIGGVSRCKIEYGVLQNRGGYGSIYRAKRVTANKANDVCVKIPHNSSFTLCPEAILQWLASETLIRAGIRGAIPPVYDIFQYAGETRFSMQFIEGISCVDCILESPTPEITFIQILAQTSLLLSYLEEHMRLDHRDLKGSNIWINPVETRYELCVGGKKWTVSAPFQVVLLDFGFSCLGSSEGNAVVSLSDGILPRIDPCPKEGRDLFQLIASIWSIPAIRSLMSEPMQRDIELLLSYRNKPYAYLVKQTLDTNWIYLLVSDSSFRHPPLHPLSLLHALSLKYTTVCISSE